MIITMKTTFISQFDTSKLTVSIYYPLCKSLQQPYELCPMTDSVLQTRKLRLRKIKQFSKKKD